MSEKRGRQAFLESLKPEYLISEDILQKEKKASDDAPDKGERELELQKNQELLRKTSNHYGTKDEIDGSIMYDNLCCDYFEGEKITFSAKQKTLLRKIVELEAKRMGIFEPSIVYEDMEDPGMYDHGSRQIWLSNKASVFRDFRDLVDSVIHEVRHCYQYCIMDHPDSFSDIPVVIKNYLQHSLTNYPEEIETEVEWEAYLKNGLEIDTNAYAQNLTFTYQQFTADQILAMKYPPQEIVKNQILMTPSDISEDGRIAPILVSAEFDALTYYTDKDKNNENHIYNKGGDYMSGRSLNISDDKQREAIGFYEDIIKEIQTSSGTMANQLGELLRSNPYEQTQVATNAFLKYYNTTLPSEIQKAINEWRNSDNCISAVVKKMGGGEAAVQNAKRYEDRLNETIRNCFMTIDEFKIDVSGTNTTDQAINEMTQMINSYQQRLETEADGWVRSVTSKEQEEMIYSSIHDVVSRTIVNVRGAFDGLHVIFSEVGIRFSELHTSITGTNIDTGTQSGTKRIDLKGKLRELAPEFRNMVGL